jgi:hypothetical protein
MTVIDDRGRLFGRVNLVDGAVLLLVLALLPLAYGSYLLFRPAQPRIESVSPSVITREEHRISSGGRLTAKFKVRGTGFTPMLRAKIGDADAIAFVFENPNSADVLVGAVAPGAHDLVLVDGAQEVARAPGAITVQPESGSFVRGWGWLTNLDAALVATLQTGFKFPEPEPAFEILAIGPLRPARVTVLVGGRQTDLLRENLQERRALLRLRCNPSGLDNPCAMSETQQPLGLSLPGPARFFGFTLEELMPDVKPRAARVRVRLSNDAPVSLMRAGDRDALLDERAAVVSAITSAGGATIVTLDLGLDEARDGWRYRGQIVKPGAPFVLETDRYEAAGRLEAVLDGAPGAPPP